MRATTLRFGDFVLDLDALRLLRSGQPVALEPKALLTLRYLAEHPGRLVGKQELLDAVWDGTAVTDNSLTHAVAQVRRALDDDSKAPRFIETAHSFGYRFIASVAEVLGATPRATAGEPVSPSPTVAPLISTHGSMERGPAVAVLPFLDLSAPRDQEYLCDGIAEEILNALCRLPGLRVAARTSSFAYRGRSEDVRAIGRELGVDALLEGSVRSAGEVLRVAVQLIDTRDGCHLWSERFDCSTADLLALEDEIACGVAARLEVGLPASNPPPSVRHRPAAAAYREFLEGRYLLHRRGPSDLRRAIEHFERAIVADRDWARPHQAIAEVFGVLGLWGLLPPPVAFARSRQAAERAVALDDDFAEAHLSLANVRFLADWDWSGAARHYARAAAAIPRAGYDLMVRGLFEAASGRPEEALRLARRGAALEPSSAVAQLQAGTLLLGLGEALDDAVPACERGHALDPLIPMGALWLGVCRALRGELVEAEALLRRAAELGLASALWYLPSVLVAEGRAGDARELVRALERGVGAAYTSPLDRLIAWAALGEQQRCAELFAAAEAERCPGFTFCLFAPGYLALSPGWLGDWFLTRRRELAPVLAGARAASADQRSRQSTMVNTSIM